jgi:hypothetical protein
MQQAPKPPRAATRTPDHYRPSPGCQRTAELRIYPQALEPRRMVPRPDSPSLRQRCGHTFQYALSRWRHDLGSGCCAPSSGNTQQPLRLTSLAQDPAQPLQPCRRPSYHQHSNHAAQHAGRPARWPQDTRRLARLGHRTKPPAVSPVHAVAAASQHTQTTAVTPTPRNRLAGLLDLDAALGSRSCRRCGTAANRPPSPGALQHGAAPRAPAPCPSRLLALQPAGISATLGQGAATLAATPFATSPRRLGTRAPPASPSTPLPPPPSRRCRIVARRTRQSLRAGLRDPHQLAPARHDLEPAGALGKLADGRGGT